LVDAAGRAAAQAKAPFVAVTARDGDIHGGQRQRLGKFLTKKGEIIDLT
jgi:hypothetical protein